MTCKDCVHEKVCKNAYLFKVTPPNVCGFFKNKADFAEVKHGYWKTVTEAKDNTVCGDNIKIQYKICSNCEEPMGLTESDYCPNCGAKMESE